MHDSANRQALQMYGDPSAMGAVLESRSHSSFDSNNPPEEMTKTMGKMSMFDFNKQQTLNSGSPRVNLGSPDSKAKSDLMKTMNAERLKAIDELEQQRKKEDAMQKAFDEIAERIDINKMIN